MNRQPVSQSKNILGVGYDGASKTLEIEFSSGGIYSYEGVPADLHQALIKSDSPGLFFTNFIRGAFPYTHLNPKPKKEAGNASRENKESASTAEKDPPKGQGHASEETQDRHKSA